MKASKKHWQSVKKAHRSAEIPLASAQSMASQPNLTPVPDKVIAMALLFW